MIEKLHLFAVRVGVRVEVRQTVGRGDVAVDGETHDGAVRRVVFPWEIAVSDHLAPSFKWPLPLIRYHPGYKL